jgi:hypothetical protein
VQFSNNRPALASSPSFVRFELRTKRKRRRTTAALAGVGLKAVIDFATAAERADHHSTIGVLFSFSNNFFGKFCGRCNGEFEGASTVAGGYRR